MGYASIKMVRILRRILAKYYKDRHNVRFSRSTAGQNPETEATNEQLRSSSPIQVLKHNLCLAYLARVGKKRLNLRESLELLQFARMFWRKVSRKHRNKRRLLTELVADIRNPDKTELAKHRSAHGISDSEVKGNETLRRMASSLNDFYIVVPRENADAINNDDDSGDGLGPPPAKRPRRH